MEKDIWKEQLERIKRYAERVRSVIYYVKYDRPADFFVDDVHAFFVECHSFKDWLINDPSYDDYSKREIENFVTCNFELALCADVANGKKHLVCHNRRNRNDPRALLRYCIEAILTPEGDPERQVNVGIKPSEFTISPNTKGLDETRAQWLDQGFAQDDIEFCMYVDIECEEKLLDYSDGIADFADDAINLWVEFIRRRRPGFSL